MQLTTLLTAVAGLMVLAVPVAAGPSRPGAVEGMVVEVRTSSRHHGVCFYPALVFFVFFLSFLFFLFFFF
jgi:hypothetical protein